MKSFFRKAFELLFVKKTVEHSEKYNKVINFLNNELDYCGFRQENVILGITQDRMYYTVIYKDFKDKFLLKTIISDYAKYLGFDSEEIIDEFNTFVFESTSKIPIDEIAKASKAPKDTDDQIASPYTATEEPKKKTTRKRKTFL